MNNKKIEQINEIEENYGIIITKSHKEFLLKINDTLLDLDNKYFNLTYGSDKYIKIFKLYSLKKIKEILKYFFESKEKETEGKLTSQLDEVKSLKNEVSRRK